MNRRQPAWPVSSSLLAVLVLGFALRVHELGAQSLWYDEAFSRVIVVNSDWREIWGIMLAYSDVSPLMYVLAKLFVPLFGTTEFGLRIPSVLWGWLTIPVVYRLGNAISGRFVGVVAAMLMAFSPFSIWYSRDFRPYGMYLFLGSIVLWGFRRAENRGRPGDWALLIASSAAFYLTHYVSALFAYAQAMYCMTRIREHPSLFRRWGGAQLLAVSPVGGWVAAYLINRHPISRPAWIPPIEAVTPLKTVWNYLTADAISWNPLTAVGAAIVVLLILWGGRSRLPGQQLLWWWLGLPLLTALLFSLRVPSYVDRYFLPAIIGVTLLLAMGLLSIPRFLRAIAISLFAVGLLAGTIRTYSDPAFAKENWREAAHSANSEGLPIVALDYETLIGFSPYLSVKEMTYLAQTEAELSERLAQGPFIAVVRSPRESAHALTKSEPFDPAGEGPLFFRQWLRDNPSVPVEVRPFAGLALVILGK